MKLRNILLALLTLIVGNIYAKNEVQTVAQVTTAITLSDDVDYVITGDTPFTEEGSVDIVNTDHAVVIIKKHRASAVISNWLKYIKINGRTAKNGSNCQVKMYNLGAIILPYSSTLHPLTCYTEPNFQGKSYNSYTEGHSGGFMKSLGTTTLNNQIRSFKLKRGYMVTFAIGKSGWGYSRCFIAANEDLEIASLPKILDGRISSYRIFKWQNFSKKGVHDESVEANAALRTEWCFGWAAGYDMLPDVENVPHHIYEDWPSASACGQATYSCHMQTNNEPGNSADDHPQDVETVLNNWQNLMRTGMRLCSESSHDGSMGHLKTFIEEIDKRGWRCDILDLHCYWDSGTFNNLTWYSDNYGAGRPIWISEWVWGASWNNNGAFASGRRSDNATYNGTVPILGVLNSNPRVERYAYWNSEADFTKIWRGNKLTKLGEYYAKMDTELGYKPENEFIPRTPPTQPINKDLKCVFNKETKIAKLTWSDLNGDANIDSMLLMCRKPGDADFTVMAKIELQDQSSKDACSYSYTTTALEEPGLYVFEVRNYVRTSVNSQTNQESVNISSVKENGLVTYGAVEIAGTGDINISDLNYTSETAPAAFFGNPTSNNTFGKSLRVKTQFANEVTVNLHPFVDASGTQKEMTTQEKIDFMFITPGEYTIDGKRLIVNSSDVAFGVSETARKHVSFATPFDEGIKPVVIVNRVSSASSTVWRQNSDYACEARVTNVTNEGFDIEIVRPAYYITASKNAISSNSINYIAMEPGSMYIGKGMKLTAEYPTLERAAARYRDAYYRYSVTLGEKLLSPHFFFGTTTKSNEIFFTLNYFQNKETTSTDEQGNVWTEKIQMHRYYDLSETLSSELIDLSEDLCYIALSTDPTKDPSDEPQITTSVVDMEAIGATQSGVIYDLTGRRLQKVPQNGIYIINNGKNSSKVLKK